MKQSASVDRLKFARAFTRSLRRASTPSIQAFLLKSLRNYSGSEGEALIIELTVAELAKRLRQRVAEN